jgi:beta-mannosidase
LKYAIEHYRREKYKKIGSFFQFLFGDCWPAITWSVVSYERKLKPGYFAVQRAFQPVLIETDLDKSVWSKGKSREAPVGLGLALNVWVVNDEHHGIEGANYEVRLRGQGREVLVGSRKEPVGIAPDAVANLPSLYCTLPSAVAPGAYELVLVLKQGDRILSENVYAMSVAE